MQRHTHDDVDAHVLEPELAHVQVTNDIHHRSGAVVRRVGQRKDMSELVLANVIPTEMRKKHMNKNEKDIQEKKNQVYKKRNLEFFLKKKFVNLPPHFAGICGESAARHHLCVGHVEGQVAVGGTWTLDIHITLVERYQSVTQKENNTKRKKKSTRMKM
jgi:hypothetical protein